MVETKNIVKDYMVYILQNYGRIFNKSLICSLQTAFCCMEDTVVIPACLPVCKLLAVSKFSNFFLHFDMVTF